MHRGKDMKKIKDTENTKQPVSNNANLPQVKKTYSKRLGVLFASGVVVFLGLALFVVYFFNENVMIGAPAIFMVIGGIILFKYYWEKTGDVITEHIGEQVTTQVNSLSLYPDKIIFENVNEPKGYPWECLNDKKKYYVNFWNGSALVPFVLPDQQYYEPGVFAERVLELPAHRKIFLRKPDLFQKIKTGLLVVAIVIVWLLIVTTTGS